jgi:hypothetical protein
VSTTGDLDRSRAQRRVRAVIEHLIAEGTVVARSDGTLHELFPVAASATEGEALRGWTGRSPGPPRCSSRGRRPSNRSLSWRFVGRCWRWSGRSCPDPRSTPWSWWSWPLIDTSVGVVVASSLLCKAQGRDGPGGIEGRPHGCGKGDDAASARLGVATLRVGSQE